MRAPPSLTQRDANRLAWHTRRVYTLTGMSPDRQPSPGWLRFGEYLKMKLEQMQLTQEQVAEMLTSVTQRGRPYQQPEISQHLLGRRFAPECVRDYVFALKLDIPEVVMTIFGDDFTDPLLDEETKRHLKRQYRMLRELVDQRRSSADGATDAEPEGDGDEAVTLG